MVGGMGCSGHRCVLGEILGLGRGSLTWDCWIGWVVRVIGWRDGRLVRWTDGHKDGYG